MKYEPNPKHKPVPQPGRRGSICPPLELEESQALLDKSLVFGAQRYASDGENVYCGQRHDRERDCWHGYPMSWSEVDPRARVMLIDSGQVERRIVRRALRAGR